METQPVWHIKVHIYAKMLQFSCHLLAFFNEWYFGEKKINDVLELVCQH